MFLHFQANKSKESQLNDVNENGVSDDGSSKKASKKKKVSFKFGLETSDDAHIVKKEPNITFDPPVSIIKKECLTRAIRIARGGESIIMPSRLTGLTQKFRHNNANNIDKLNSLTFKSQIAKKDTSEESVSSNDDEQSDGEAENSERKRDSDDNTESDEESSHSKNDDDNEDDEHSKGIAFQLPKRSSRVIKPNKRFTDDSKPMLNKNGLGKKKGSKPEIDADSIETTKKEGMFNQKLFIFIVDVGFIFIGHVFSTLFLF